MRVEDFVKIISSDFYSGVPDSKLKALCNYLFATYGIDGKHHIIAANEGNAVAVAAGYYLSTGRVPVVYMQNSGQGNVINPLASLLNKKVYAIPMIFVVGWRGEPGIHDEPQHKFQGEITMKLFEAMGVSAFVISDNTTIAELKVTMNSYREKLAKGEQVAFVIRKNGLTYEKDIIYKNQNEIIREKAIKRIVEFAEKDFIVSTTGKASRELYEIRESGEGDHSHDFLTVGSMGHSSSIALGLALNKSDKKIWCIDGDGALLMHMGAMAVIGSQNPKNLVHIVMNNGSHETVGGMPTVSESIDLCGIARACNYNKVMSCDNYNELEMCLKESRDSKVLTFLEIKCAIESRDDLKRPTLSPIENKNTFIYELNRRAEL